MKRAVIIGLVLVLSLTMVTMVAADAGFDPGSGSTNFTVMNLDKTNPSDVIASYINQAGAVEATLQKTIQPVSSEGFPITESGLPDGWSGSVIVSAGTEIVAFVQGSWSGGTYGDGNTAGAYNGFVQGANKLYFPSLAARMDKQFSRLTVQSAEAESISESISVDITFYDRLGAVSLGPINASILKGTQQTWDLMADVTLPDNWLGAAVVESTSPIAGVATMHWQQYSAAYSGVTGGGPISYLPSATRRVPDGSTWLQYTGVIAQNLDAAVAANVTVTWYDRLGNNLYSFNDVIPANSAHGYNTRHTAGSDIPSGDVAGLEAALGNDWNGSVVIESTGGQDIVVVNNLQWTDAHPAKASASAYTSEASGYAEVFVPATFRRIDAATSDWNQYTGLILQNVGSAACNNFDVEWRDRTGALLMSYQDSLNQNISHGYNTKAGSASDIPGTVSVTSLGDDFRGSVYVNAPGCELMAIHNTLWQIRSQATTYNAFGQ